MKTAYPMISALLGVSLFVTACGGSSVAVALPEAPDAALEAITKELSEGNAAVLWQALPESYRTDLTGIAHEAGSVLDADLYDRSFSLVGRLADVADKQRNFILNSQFTGGMDLAQAEASWDSVLKLLRLVSNSEISTVAGLQSLDFDSMLGGTGSELLNLVDEVAVASGEEPPVAGLAEFSAEVVDAGESTATLRMMLPGEPETTEAFTKVEGRWVPSQLASQWASQMDGARAQLKQVAEGAGAESKPQVMGALSMFEGVLGQLEAAETQEQFDQALQGAMMPVMGLMMMMNGGMGGGLQPGPAVPPAPLELPAGVE